MHYSIDDLKRLKICPILFEKKWDYTDPSKDLIPTYLYGMKEIFRWYYRRSSHITPDVIAASISSHAMQHRVDITTKIGLESAFRKYVESAFYKEMQVPHYNKELVLKLNEIGDIVNHVTPVVTKKDKTIYFVSFNLGETTPEDFLNRYETIFQTVWSFYVLDMVPAFVNLYYENGEIKEQRFKVNQNYVARSKEKLIQAGRGLKYSKNPPPPDICRNCNRRSECQEQTLESMLRK